MSYAPEFSRQVRRFLLDLSFDEAEFLFDELERLLEHPVSVSESSGSGGRSQIFLTEDIPGDIYHHFVVEFKYGADEETLCLETVGRVGG